MNDSLNWYLEDCDVKDRRLDLDKECSFETNWGGLILEKGGLLNNNIILACRLSLLQ